MNKLPTPPTKPLLQTILITGSSGLIGSSFIDRLGEMYREMGFGREGPPHPPPSTEHVIGAFSYLLDALAGLVGGRRRWRPMPWMVLLFGLFIIPPGVTSIVLVILRPVSVSAWCTLCLGASVVMLLMVPPAVIAFAEPARLVRYLNVLCGVWVLVAPWLFEGAPPSWPWIGAASGLALIVLSLRRGRVEDRYAGWQRFVC